MSVVEISPAELKTLIDEDGAPLLLDVREAWEFKQARIAGSINVPMQQVPARVDDLRTGAPVVAICHHGGRSQAVAQFLVDHASFSQVYNLAGGVDAWAQEVDPSMPRY